MRLGVHVSIGGGLAKGVARAVELGCECIQIFSSNPNSWKVGETDPVVAEKFRVSTEDSGIRPVVLHTPYLLNLASGKPQVFNPSWRTLGSALTRADMLGAKYIVTHIGSHGGDGLEAGARRIKDAVNRALDEALGDAMVLLEGGSGAGNTVGSIFEEQAHLLDLLSDRSERVGICLDTAHLWGAGYDLSSAENVGAVLSDFDRLIGTKRLHVFHLNDTQKALDSHIDRHWYVGQGNVGLEGFRAIVNYPALAGIAAIIEVPGESVEVDQKDLNILKTLRSPQAEPWGY
jgi:deoxyribonuclease-4